MKLMLWMVGASAFASLAAVANEPLTQRSGSDGDRVQCANLVYAVNKTSVCFSGRFLDRLRLETKINTAPNLSRARLGSNEIFNFPFAIMTGEGDFSLTPAERINLKYYVTHGGFLLASASCSDPAWTRAFRTEMNKIFPENKMKVIPTTHTIYRTVYTFDFTRTIHDHRSANLEGLFYQNRIVAVFSPDGLNDTTHAEGCCCCGGDEVERAEYMNVNILAYALLH
jgi:hypothetical protein